MSRIFTNGKPRRSGVPRFGTLTLVAGLFLAGGSDANSEERVLQNWLRWPECVQWDDHASQAIVRKVTGRHGGLDVQRLGEDLFRMRRARRNCDLGMVRAACEDYFAIVRDIGGASSDWHRSGEACPPALAEEPPGGDRQAPAGRE